MTKSDNADMSNVNFVLNQSRLMFKGFNVLSNTLS